ncbi:MAG: hypothetical protein AAFU60_07890 [Bacteroidota bacterium]
MSLKEYKENEETRQDEAKKASAHYKSVNLTGDRTFEVDTDAVRKRIAQMKEEAAKPNHKK